ncbi:MAG TPA: hypothetical protein VMT63_12750 [Bacteroidales bacterium]|nr:hypothetical protein [Bacteroidales bacterium]
MGKLLLAIYLALVSVFLPGNAAANEFREHISREFSLQNNGHTKNLLVYNFSGFIKVEGYAGDKIVMEIDKEITAGSENDLATGKKELKLSYDLTDDSITAYLEAPYDTRPRNSYHKRCNCDPPYSFKLDFTIRVPSGMNLTLSTVNDGVVSAKLVWGNLNLCNVNGEIWAEKIKGKTSAHTVNGDVNISYLSNPSEESSFYTVNGDITVTFQPDLSANLEFRSMNGQFYTNFPDAHLIPLPSRKYEEESGGSRIYRLSRATVFRFGKGGKDFNFETLNGDIFIKHI